MSKGFVFVKQHKQYHYFVVLTKDGKVTIFTQYFHLVVKTWQNTEMQHKKYQYSKKDLTWYLMIEKHIKLSNQVPR